MIAGQDTAAPDAATEVYETQPIPLIEENMLPDLIQDQINELKNLDTSVKVALAAAQEAETKAKAAQEKSAERGLFKDYKKEAIEGLQAAGLSLAEAVQSGVKAQKISFDFQTRLTNVSKSLFALGVSNIAANRAVVRNLEKRLSGASEEELSELAYDEIISVVRQLKEQEDLLKKQEKIFNILKEHHLDIGQVKAKNDDFSIVLDLLNKKFEQQEMGISALREKISSHHGDVQKFSTSMAEVQSKAAQNAASLGSVETWLKTMLIFVVVACSATAYFLH